MAELLKFTWNCRLTGEEVTGKLFKGNVAVLPVNPVMDPSKIPLA